MHTKTSEGRVYSDTNSTDRSAILRTLFLPALILLALGTGMAQVANGQAALPAPAQTMDTPAPATTTSTGTVRGHITDPTGALIPGAKVTITTSAGTAVTSAIADASGAYSVSGLAPGSYLVNATCNGF